MRLLLVEDNVPLADELLASAVVQADIEVPLGSTQRVTQLFAFPNN